MQKFQQKNLSFQKQHSFQHYKLKQTFYPQALSRVGLTEEEKKSVYSVVGAVLHLGNVEFEEDSGARGGCRVTPNSEQALATAAGLLGVDPGELRMALVSRLMQSSRGGIKGTAIMWVFDI